jgi:filamentous hemagglutinin
MSALIATRALLLSIRTGSQRNMACWICAWSWICCNLWAMLSWLQQKGAQLIGDLVHNGELTTAEAAPLHALVACAGQAAAGGSCGAGAAGATASSALNLLLDSVVHPFPEMTATQIKGQTELFQALVTGIGAAAGVQGSALSSALASAQAEIDNNGCAGCSCAQIVPPGTAGSMSYDKFKLTQQYAAMYAVLGSDQAVMSCLTKGGSSQCGAALAQASQVAASTEGSQTGGQITGTIIPATPTIASTIVSSLTPEQQVLLANNPLAAQAAQATDALSLEVNVATRMPGQWGQAAQDGIIIGTAAALGLAKLGQLSGLTSPDSNQAPTFTTPVQAPDTANIGTTIADSKEHQQGNSEGMQAAQPSAASPGTTIDTSGSTPLPGLQADLPSSAGTVLASEAQNSDTSKGPATSEGTANAATGAKLGDDLAATMAKPQVSDQKLAGLINDLYRNGATIGSGSTADAVRYEAANGQAVGGKLHTQKARDYSTALQNWLDANPNASFSDRSAVQNVLRNLQNALNGK